MSWQVCPVIDCEVRRSRKARRCDASGQVIRPGDLYVSNLLTDGGAVVRWKTTYFAWVLMRLVDHCDLDESWFGDYLHDIRRRRGEGFDDLAAGNPRHLAKSISVLMDDPRFVICPGSGDAQLRDRKGSFGDYFDDKTKMGWSWACEAAHEVVSDKVREIDARWRQKDRSRIYGQATAAVVEELSVSARVLKGLLNGSKKAIYHAGHLTCYQTQAALLRKWKEIEGEKGAENDNVV